MKLFTPDSKLAPPTVTISADVLQQLHLLLIFIPTPLLPHVSSMVSRLQTAAELIRRQDITTGHGTRVQLTSSLQSPAPMPRVRVPSTSTPTVLLSSSLRIRISSMEITAEPVTPTTTRSTILFTTRYTASAAQIQAVSTSRTRTANQTL